MSTSSAERRGFGLLLQQHRLAAGLTQEELAERAGMSRRGIADLERGARRAPHPATMRRLSKALRLPPAARAELFASARVEPLEHGQTATPSLPIPPTSFVGRAKELAEVRQLLLTTRLLTLTGAGGSGKTRLALEAARASTEQFSDGVTLVLLGAIADPDLVLPAIAAALGVQEVADRHLAESVIAYLRPRSMLLLVDNFEHLLAAATVLTDVLASCPNVSALCTSRQPLGVRGEHEFSVQPLQLPPVDHSTPPDALVNCASVMLLAERTSEMVKGFSVTSKNARSLADICIRLDGLPLAIELVASRLKVLSPSALLERLTRRLPLLVGGQRDLPARQRTLRDTIAWSHDLLDAGDQRLFRRLAVFAGGCTLAAAEALCDEDADLGRSVLDGLAELVGLNLLQRHDTASGEPRFSMLETIREFGVEQLEQSGDALRVRERHAQVFVQFAEDVEPHLATGGRAPWLARVASDQENLRAALRWSVEQCRPELGLRIVGALWLWYFLRFREGQVWAKALLRLPDTEGTSYTRAKALHMAATTSWAAGDRSSVARYGSEGIALARMLGSPERLAYALSVTASSMPDPHQRLHAHYAEGLAAAQQAGDPWLAACVRMCYAVAAAQLGDLTTTVDQGRLAVDEGRAVGDAWLVAIAAGPLGLGLVQIGEIDEGEARLRDALEPLRLIGDWKWVINCLIGLGLVARRRGDRETMLRVYSECLRLCRDVGDTGNLPLAIEGLSAAAAALGDWTSAARLLGAAEAAHAVGDEPILPVYDELFEATRAAVRDAMSLSAFTAAHQEGQRLSTDQAVVAGQSMQHRVREFDE